MATQRRRNATTTFIGARLPNAVVDALWAEAKARRIPFTRALLQAVLGPSQRFLGPVKPATPSMTDIATPAPSLNTTAPRFTGDRRSDQAQRVRIQGANGRSLGSGFLDDAASALDGSRRVAAVNIHPDDRPFVPKRR